MQHATLTTEQVRALIARGKLRDTLFQALGIFFLGVGLIVIFLLVGDMVLRGAGRLNLDFFTQFASRRAGSAGRGVTPPLARLVSRRLTGAHVSPASRAGVCRVWCRVCGCRVC